MNEISDKLTGLYNRKGFYAEVEKRLAENHTEQLIIYFDIKNFKLVNTAFGMEEGDRLLRRIGHFLQENLPAEAICGRLECDRFCVQVSSENGQECIEEILNQTFHAGDLKTGTFQIHIDIGVYMITDFTMEVSAMCDRARMALETIKDNRMSRVALYNDGMFEQLRLEQELSADLPAALIEGQIRLYVQPQVDGDGRMLGGEALMRWEHPTRGLLMPGDFLGIFEKNYMIVEIDKYMWEKSCRMLRQWMDQGIDDVYLSVNISPCDLECMDVCRVLSDLVEKYGVPHKKLRVEITETTIMQNPQRQIKLVGRLRAAGFYVDMDDFGSGYSSFSMLKDMYMDALKLDMKFLDNRRDRDRGDTILHAMVSLVKSLDMTVIAEGVETKEQVEFLKGIGCDVFQGFYFSRPMPIEQFEETYLNTTPARINEIA
jgi:diguanylate cyclase (GGDEF)-like protein